MTEISLALGGGGIKGIAHIGVLRVLEKHGFEVKAIAGTSAGGIVGATYAAGLTPDKIDQIITQANQKKLFARAKQEGPALMGLSGLYELLTTALGDITFNELKISFACTSVELETGQEMILNQGRVVDAIMATIAVPGIFPAKWINGFQLVDGGIIYPVPLALARWLAPNLPVVAVCLSPEQKEWAYLPPIDFTSAPLPRPIVEQISKLRISQAFRIYLEAMEITSRSVAELRLQIDTPEVLIRPDVILFGILDEVAPEKLMALGEQAAEEAIPEIRKATAWPRKLPRLFRRANVPGKILPVNEDEDEPTQ